MLREAVSDREILERAYVYIPLEAMANADRSSALALPFRTAMQNTHMECMIDNITH